jgi:hypothetical protein
MGQTNILERSTLVDESEFVPSETEFGLNVAVIYQNTAARKWATQVCDHVKRVAGNDAVHSTWWEISSLSDPDVFRDAILMTIVADVILVSINDAEELPIDLCVWIDAWLPRRYLPMGALIALISVPGQADDQTNHARDYLRTVARKGRLDFLLRERRLPVTSRGYFFLEKTKEWTDPTSLVVQEALSHEHGNLLPSNDL